MRLSTEPHPWGCGQTTKVCALQAPTSRERSKKMGLKIFSPCISSFRALTPVGPCHCSEQQFMKNCCLSKVLSCLGCLAHPNVPPVSALCLYFENCSCIGQQRLFISFWQPAPSLCLHPVVEAVCIFWGEVQHGAGQMFLLLRWMQGWLRSQARVRMLGLLAFQFHSSFRCTDRRGRLLRSQPSSLPIAELG